MMIMIMPIGKAEIMLTDWILLMELSEKTSPMGKTINRMHHSRVMSVCGCSFSPSFL